MAYFELSFVIFLQCVDGIKPTLSELEKFEEQPEGLEIECKLQGVASVSPKNATIQSCNV